MVITIFKIFLALVAIGCLVYLLVFACGRNEDKHEDQDDINEDDDAIIICSPASAERIKKDAPQLANSLLIATWVDDSEKPDSVMLVTSREWTKFINTGTFLEASDNAK